MDEQPLDERTMGPRHKNVADWHDESTRSHLSRYYMARGFVKPMWTVKDVACGCGYGSEILAEVAGHVVGMDFNERVIEHANESHKGANVEFLVEDFDMVSEIRVSDMSVSIETIEHVRDPKKFADLLKTSTRKLIFISTPLIPTIHKEPLHRTDFSRHSLRELFVDESWGVFDCFGQGENPNPDHGQYIFYRK